MPTPGTRSGRSIGVTIADHDGVRRRADRVVEAGEAAPDAAAREVRRDVAASARRVDLGALAEPVRVDLLALDAVGGGQRGGVGGRVEALPAQVRRRGVDDHADEQRHHDGEADDQRRDGAASSVGAQSSPHGRASRKVPYGASCSESTRMAGVFEPRAAGISGSATEECTSARTTEPGVRQRRGSGRQVICTSGTVVEPLVA